MSKTTKMVLSILIGVFVLMSLVPYAQKTNPKTDAKLSIKAPDDIMAIFKKSCMIATQTKQDGLGIAVYFHFLGV